MAEESGKSRALRVRLDYYKQQGPLYWSRWFAAAVAAISCGSYGLVVLIASWLPAGSRSWLSHAAVQVSTGSVAQVHAHFEHDCQQCHSANWREPIAADAVKIDVQASISHVSEACQRCHSVDSHVRHNTDAECRLQDQNCAVCHQEHRGREADLIRVSADLCVSCHADLRQICDGEFSVESLQIRDFSIDSHSAAGTQQFRSLTHDPGRIKFDHGQHLNPGQVDADSRGGFRHDMLTDRWRAAYVANADGMVQLECTSCHQLQHPSGTGRRTADIATRSATDIELAHYYAPVDFELHCAGCHQMTFAGQTSDMLPLPHAATRAEVGQLLSANLVGGRISGQIRSPRDASNDAVGATLEQVELNVGVDRVFTACMQCHIAEDLLEERIQLQLSDPTAKPMVPSAWLRRGMFNHGAHEKITNCRFCHEIGGAQAGLADVGQPPRDYEFVMIKGPESCVPCHRDARIEPNIDLSTAEKRSRVLGQAQQPDLARTDCILCHRYHWSRSVVESRTSSGRPAVRGTL